MKKAATAKNQIPSHKGLSRQSFLVIGGSQFMGRTLVERLLSEKIEVTICNRGKTPSPFGDEVKYITVDRLNNRKEFCRCAKSNRVRVSGLLFS